MTKDEHNAILTQLRDATSLTESDRALLILQLENDYTGVLAENETAISERDLAVNESKTYQDVNNKLWLQVSAQNKQNTEILNLNDKTNDKTNYNEIPQKLTFGDLEAKMMEEYGGNK